ncbi:MAG TPA: transporter [Allosphingosinicella sp.]|jgi:hypothetical protein|nr:transporter [Allosphingosinicella sp.]
MRVRGLLLAAAALPAAALATPAAAQTAAAPAAAQSGQSMDELRGELREARGEIAEQRQRLDAQDARIRALEGRLNMMAGNAAPGQPAQPGQAPGTAPVQVAQGSAAPPAGVEHVGEAPQPRIEVPQVPVLGDQGAVITRAGQFTFEPSLEYVRSDRNTALFRGVSVAESLLIGVFDISETHQDLLTAATTLRYGVTNRLELSVRAPFVYRFDSEVLTPVANAPGANTQSEGFTDKAYRLGDVEFDARYQITPARADRPFVIGTLQVVAPTGSNPFGVPRDSQGRELRAATGAGFWGVTPGVTAILPTDPGVLFGSLSYTHNFARNENTQIPPVLITHVDPGDSFALSLGIGLALNQRTSINFGYSHSWILGSHSTVQLLAPQPNDPNLPVITATRDLQLGRFLFGISYRVSDKTTINWALEVGATADAPDIRTTLRIPITFGS